MLKKMVIAQYNCAPPPPPVEEQGILLESHFSHIKFIAERIASRLPTNIELDDLIGAGVIGLIDAFEKFDPTRGIQFKTYAELRIRGAILDSLRDLDWVPRSIRKRAKTLEATYNQLERRYGRPATEEEVAGEMGISLAELQSSLGEMQWLKITEIDKEDENGNYFFEIRDQSMPSPFEQYQESEVKAQLSQAIDRLPEKERQVVALYYLEELTMKEIGLVLGITESRISQLHNQAILRLRSIMKSTKKGE